MGLSDVIISNRIERVFRIISKILNDMVSEEKEVLLDIQEQVNAFDHEIKQLYSDLNIDYQPPEPKTLLIERKIALEEIVKTLRSRKNSLLQEWHHLTKVRQELASKIGVILKSTNSNTIPSDAQRSEIISEIHNLENDLKSKQSKFIELKNDLRAMIHEMNMECNDPFLKQILDSQSENTIVLNQENIDKVISCKNTITSEYSSLQKRISDSYVELECLWSLLNVDPCHVEKIKRENKSCCQRVLDTLCNEIKRLKSIRINKIAQYLPNIREKLNCTWRKCRFGPEKVKQFIIVYGNEISEDALVAHEKALIQAEEFYKENEQIFKLLEKFEQLWSHYYKFELNITSIDKFKNRGGILLKEERLRNAVYRELPIVQNELKSLIEEYDAKNLCQFLIDDKTFEEDLLNRYQSLRFEKEEIKRNRQQSKTPNSTPIKYRLDSTCSTPKSNHAISYARTCQTEKAVKTRPIIHNMGAVKRRSSIFYNDLRFIGGKKIPRPHVNHYDLSKSTILKETTFNNIQSPTSSSPIYDTPIKPEIKKRACQNENDVVKNCSAHNRNNTRTPTSH